MRVESYTAPVQATVAGGFYAIGQNGDDDPGYELCEVVVVNTGTTAIRVGHSLTDILAGRYTPIPAATAIPLEGPYDNIVVYNPEVSTAAAWGLTAMCGSPNSGHHGGLAARSTPSSANRYTVIRPNKVAGASTPTTIRVPYRRLLKSIKAYSVSKASGATIEIDLLNAAGASLLAAKMDAEALTNKTLYTATTLSTTVSLTVSRDLTLTYSSSAGGDTLGDILIELAQEVA